MKSQPQPVKVFVARDLSKIYVMGEVKVHALRDINLDIYEREFVVLLAPRVPANRHCSIYLEGLTRRQVARGLARS